MKKIVLIFGVSALIFSCNNVDTSNSELSTQMDSVSYSLGVSVANNLKSSGFETIESSAISAAFNDVFSENDVKISEEDANALIQDYFMELSQKKSQEATNKGQAFLDENATKDGVVTTASGLQYQVLTEGQGAKPVASDEVTVHYHGTLI
ncbi:MAG: FKBP-type peptidyl-prolyl cis-trans isomerase N-terminal domain-containing protein, partial [Flavobacteriales bacterium]|nr:FKBP-type peptidyl-prolyl cis-trans isomerase N-terminal domain-containing protein [Flavobacteriales bacterium]